MENIIPILDNGKTIYSINVAPSIFVPSFVTNCLITANTIRVIIFTITVNLMAEGSYIILLSINCWDVTLNAPTTINSVPIRTTVPMKVPNIFLYMFPLKPTTANTKYINGTTDRFNTVLLKLLIAKIINAKHNTINIFLFFPLFL